jgi:hypothetical protein
MATMGPGSHVGFLISAKSKNLVYDHPINISGKFGSNLFCGFRKKDEKIPIRSNVKLRKKCLKVFSSETSKSI